MNCEATVLCKPVIEESKSVNSFSTVLEYRKESTFQLSFNSQH